MERKMLCKIDFENRQELLPLSYKLKMLVRRAVETTLDYEQYENPIEVSVTFTDNDGIRELNRKFRNIDRPTDVLSFPMFELTPGELPEDWSEYRDPATHKVPLGDMAISLERAKAQAAEFGHSAEREVGYLTIHSVLHLLGYDHVDEGPMKKQMRAREEAILAEVELPRA